MRTPLLSLILACTLLSAVAAQAGVGYRCTGKDNSDIEFDVGVHDTYANLSAAHKICMMNDTRAGDVAGTVTYSVKGVLDFGSCALFSANALSPVDRAISFTASAELVAGAKSGDAVISYTRFEVSARSEKLSCVAID